MPLFCIASPKGGVGKTTLTASLACLARRQGHPVLVLDLDPQNATRLHFGLPVSETAGFAVALTRRRPWRSELRETESGVYVLPHGDMSLRQSLELAKALTVNPALLSGPVLEMLEDPDLIVFADMAPGPSAALAALAPIADGVIAVLLADAASAALIPQIANRQFLGRGTLSAAVNRKIRVVLNQVDEDSSLSTAVMECAVQSLGTSLIGAVCRDPLIAEALGQQTLYPDYVTESPALMDLETLLDAMIGLVPVPALDVPPPRTMPPRPDTRLMPELKRRPHDRAASVG